MGTVTISSVTYTIYGTYDTAAQTPPSASDYLGGALHGAAWASANADKRKQALVTAARMLDRQRWQDAYGTFAARDAIAAIVYASYELALALLGDLSVQTGRNVKRIDDKGVGVEFFKPIEGGTLPDLVEQLVGPYLASASSAGDAYATGTDEESQFEDDDAYGLNGGL